MDKIYSKNSDVVFRKIADEYILVPVKNSIGDMESIYSLNGSAARIWELVDGKKRLSEIKKAIVGEFDVDEKSAEDDILSFSQELEKIGLVLPSA